MGLTAFAFAHDGRTLYAGNQWGQIQRWRVADGEALPTLSAGEVRQPLDSTGWVTGLFFPPDGRSVISVGWGDGVVRRWDPAAGTEIPRPGGFSGSVLARPSPDGRSVAVADQRGRLEVFDAVNGLPVRLLRPAGPRVTDLRWSPDGGTLALTQTDQAVVLWDVAAGRESRTLPRPEAPVINSLGTLDGLDFSPDGRHLLVSQYSLGTRLLDVATGRQIWHHDAWGKVAFAPDGKSYALAGVDGFQRVYTSLHVGDAATGAVRSSHRFQNKAMGGPRVIDVVFAPDGACLATNHGDGTVRTRDSRTGAERLRWQGAKGAVCSSIAFAPNGRWLVSGWSDGRVRLLEVATGKELFQRGGHDAGITAVEFGPGCKTALSSSNDGTALLWDLRPSRGHDAGTAWDDLASGDGARAYRAVRALADDPKSASLLRQKLPPVRLTLDEGRVRQLVADLNADAFETRDKATKELAALGRPVVPLLRTALAGDCPAEVRRRLQSLVDELTGAPGPEDLRRQRAVQSQELAATPEARALLREWCAGLPLAPLTEEARAALGRLERAGQRRAGSGGP
jgi:WD40 repeat protein